MPLTRRMVMATAGSSLAAQAFLDSGNVVNSQNLLSVQIPLAWLQERMSIEEAERRFTPKQDDRANYVPELRKPFGFLNARWEELKARVQTGDQIWTFSSPPETWELVPHSFGIALVRENKVIAAVILGMS